MPAVIKIHPYEEAECAVSIVVNHILLRRKSKNDR